MTLKSFYSQLHSRSQVIHQNHIRQIVYLNYLTTHAFILAITFAPFSCDLSKFFTLIYSLFAFSFISLPVMKSMCNTPKYLYLPRLTLSYAFHQIMRFPLSEPSFASSRLVPYTCLDEMQYQHCLKKLARSGYTKPILSHSLHTDLNYPKKQMIQFLFLPCYISKVCLIQDYQWRSKTKNKNNSPWKIPLLISFSPRLSLHAINSVFFDFLKYVHDNVFESHHFHNFNHPTMWYHFIDIFVINLCHFEITLVFLTVLQKLLLNQGLVFRSSWVFAASLLFIW